MKRFGRFYFKCTGRACLLSGIYLLLSTNSIIVQCNFHNVHSSTPKVKLSHKTELDDMQDYDALADFL